MHQNNRILISAYAGPEVPVLIHERASHGEFRVTDTLGSKCGLQIASTKERSQLLGH